MCAGRTNSPLVSIVIPVYNGANYLGEAIESALAQTYPNIEILVVDDGSTDDGATAAVARRFGSAIRYLHKTNGGVATALNLGIQEMRGELFSWLSHDDLYKPEKVAVQVEAWRHFGRPCVVVGDFEVMDESGQHLCTLSTCGRNLLARPLDGVFHGMINGCTLLIPRVLFERAGLFNPGLPTTQDYHLWYRMARMVPFMQSPHALVRQRSHPQQGSRQMAHLDEADRLFAHLIDETPFALMRDYEGSEVRFLLRLQKALAPYPGASAYAAYRIGVLLARASVAVVFLDGGPVADSSIDANKGGPFGTAEVVRLRTALFANDASLLSAGFAETGAEFLFFTDGWSPKSPALLRLALEEMFFADADVAWCRNRTEKAKQLRLTGLAVRRRAMAALLGTCDGGSLDPERLAAVATTTHYDPAVALARQASDRPLQPSPSGDAPLASDRLEAALSHAASLDYVRPIHEAAAADWLLQHFQPSLPTILFIAHAHSGGTWAHLNSLIRTLTGRANCLIAQGNGGFKPSLTLWCPTMAHAELHASAAGKGLSFALPSQIDDCVRLLHRVGVMRVDVHHTMGFEGAADSLLQALGLPYDVTMVDYHTLAIDPHLCGANGRFVGESRLIARDPWIMRAAPLPTLLRADRVIAISRDVAARLRRLCPELPTVCAAHWARPAPEARHVYLPRLWDGEPLRVLLIGQLNAKKGRSVVLEAARILESHRLPVRLHVLGEVSPPLSAEFRDAEAQGILICHGPFATGKLSEAVGHIAPHVAWLPSQAPETWSYVLSDIMELCLPLAASAIGAIPERCSDRPCTWLLPWESSAEDWVALFLRLHVSELRIPSQSVAVHDLPPAQPFYVDDYLRPTRVGAVSSPFPLRS